MIYPEATDRDYALHTGPRFGSIRNPNPEVPPDINVPVDALHALATGIGGDLRIGDKVAYANCFVIVEPGTTIVIESDFGALFHVWSEGTMQWQDGKERSDLFGF